MSETLSIVFIRNQITQIYTPFLKSILYSVSASPGCDVSTHAQLISLCTHSLFLSVREPGCAISLAARHLELRFANKHATCQEMARRSIYFVHYQIGGPFQITHCTPCTFVIATMRHAHLPRTQGILKFIIVQNNIKKPFLWTKSNSL